MKALKKITGLRSTFVVFFIMGTMGVAQGADTATLERIEKIIKQQQAQIEQQAETIEKLRIQVEALSGQAPKIESTAPAMVEKKDPEDITRQ
jgi:cell division protein FtsB